MTLHDIWSLELLTHCLSSLLKIMLGVSLATILGITAGLARAQLPLYYKKNPILNFLLEAPKFPPPIAWIPFIILVFGIGDWPAILIVFIGAFPPIFTAVYDGAESVPIILKNTAESFDFRGFRYLFKIILPAILPSFFTGLRSGLAMGWMAVIAAEMISGQSGLGYSIQLNRLNLQYAPMVTNMICIGLLGFLLVKISDILEKIIAPWSSRYHQKNHG